MAADLAIEDAPSPAQLLKRLSVVEKEAADRVAQLEGQVKSLQNEISVLRVTPFTPTFDLPCFDPYRRPDGRVVTSSAANPDSLAQWYEHGLCTFRLSSRTTHTAQSRQKRRLLVSLHELAVWTNRTQRTLQ